MPRLPSLPIESHSLAVDRRASRHGSEVALILDRAQFLPDADRELIHAVYKHHQSVAQVARLSNRNAPRLRTHLQRLTRRLLHRRFVFVASRLRSWPPTRRAVAQACFLHGLSMRAAAKHLNISTYIARRHYEAIDAMAAELDARRIA